MHSIETHPILSVLDKQKKLREIPLKYRVTQKENEERDKDIQDAIKKVKGKINKESVQPYTSYQVTTLDIARLYNFGFAAFMKKKLGLIDSYLLVKLSKGRETCLDGERYSYRYGDHIWIWRKDCYRNGKIYGDIEVEDDSGIPWITKCRHQIEVLYHKLIKPLLCPLKIFFLKIFLKSFENLLTKVFSFLTGILSIPLLPENWVSYIYKIWEVLSGV